MLLKLQTLQKQWFRQFFFVFFGSKSIKSLYFLRKTWFFHASEAPNLTKTIVSAIFFCLFLLFWLFCVFWLFRGGSPQKFAGGVGPGRISAEGPPRKKQKTQKTQKRQKRQKKIAETIVFVRFGASEA